MRLLLLTLAFAAGSARAADFSLKTDGDNICREQAGKPELCLKSLRAAGLMTKEAIDLHGEMESLKAFNDVNGEESDISLADMDVIGGALILSPFEIDSLLAQYKSMSVRNLALDMSKRTDAGDYVMIPFFGTLEVTTANSVVSTVNVQGQIKQLKEEALVIDRQDRAVLRALFADKILVDEVSGTDSQYAMKSMIAQAIGPMLMEEIGFLPNMKAVMLMYQLQNQQPYKSQRQPPAVRNDQL